MRPPSAVSISTQPASPSGLPKMREPSTTVVSAARTGKRGPAAEGGHHGLRLADGKALDIAGRPLADLRGLVDVGGGDAVADADLVKELAAARGRRSQDDGVVTH